MQKVFAPGTVDDAYTTELHAVENHFKIISDVDPYTFYYCEGDYVLDEDVAEGELISSELLKLVKCTGAVHDTDNVAIPAGFVEILC